MVNFYRHFIPHCAQLTLPLTNLSNLDFTLPVEYLKSIDVVKSALTQATLLAFPTRQSCFLLRTGASASAVGAVIHQSGDNDAQPFA